MTAWSQTVGQLCQSAAYELGALGMGDTLESTEQAEMNTRLNSMLAKWSIDGNLFRETTGTVTIPAGTGTMVLDDTIRDVRSVRFAQAANNKRMLAMWNRDEYFQLPNRIQSGLPMSVYISKQLGGDVLYLWPVPSADVDLELDYSRAFEFTSGPEETIDIPAEWHEAVLYGLASRCAGIFGTLQLDPAKVQRCDTQAISTYQRMLDADRPSSYYFEYDSEVR